MPSSSGKEECSGIMIDWCFAGVLLLTIDQQPLVSHIPPKTCMQFPLSGSDCRSVELIYQERCPVATRTFIVSEASRAFDSVQSRAHSFGRRCINLSSNRVQTFPAGWTRHESSNASASVVAIKQTALQFMHETT